ncbi:flagellar protein FliO/FliZ [Anoxybacillus vitaminiphilus]|uniref:Flagellar protein n=1 Tax=Paranoxybacillus vitaminiphilus TaxID=581036 RepID=A0A327YS49_9BACL|nr:flagellar biosynthetic protein FliO [Anoxybacillus vitaminiphilus]RAK23381.1 flagellar protein FliO/FliZ [Anoxybacillus vitaminiphilus]
MLHFRIVTVLIYVIVLLASQTGVPVFAEQPKTVKECIEHPEQCKDPPSQTDGEKINDDIANGQDPFSVWDVFKMILATIFVVGLIYGLLRFINRRIRLSPTKRSFIENLGGTSVGPNRSVQLIKVGNRILVIGVADSIQLLAEIDEDEEMKEILTEYNAGLNQMIEPSRWLKNWRAKESGASDASFRSILTKQLQEIAVERKKALQHLEKKGSISDE